MTNEELRDQINKAIRLHKEADRVVNTALNNAQGQMNRVEREAYDRGLNDCWEMIGKIIFSGEGTYTMPDINDIFGPVPNYYDAYATFSHILDMNTPQQALAKVRAWEEKKAEEERKKQEEAEKIQIGDVVEVYDITGANRELVTKGICLACGRYDFVVLHEGPLGFEESSFDVKMFTAIKTGKHLDILGMLK